MLDSTQTESMPDTCDDELIRLTSRFLHPINLLRRYYAFHSNAAALTKPDTQIHEFHKNMAREYFSIILRASVIA